MTVLAPRRDAARLVICPNTVLALVCFVAVLFITPLGAAGALAFLLAGTALVLRRYRANLAALALRDGWILLLPAWCITSTLWSAHPDLSLRHGIQLGLTTVIALTIAARLSPRTLLRTVLVATTLAALASLAFGRARLDGGGYLGIYGSKNAFAQVMAVFTMAGLALALGREGGRGWRLAGLAAVPTGLVLLAMGQSAGWLIAALLAAASGLCFAVLRRFSPGARLIAVAMSLLAAAALGILVWANQAALMAQFLDLTGKDVTLTGRTDLWRIALVEIARQPLLGQGYQAVWVEGNPLAEDIWRRYGIASKSGFHFHNTWLSNAVEIGVIGVALQAAVFLVALVTTLRAVLHRARSETLFLAMYMVVQAVMSLIEVIGFTQFQIGTMLILIAASQGSRARFGAAPYRGIAPAAPMPVFLRSAWREG